MPKLRSVDLSRIAVDGSFYPVMFDIIEHVGQQSQVCIKYTHIDQKYIFQVQTIIILWFISLLFITIKMKQF